MNTQQKKVTFNNRVKRHFIERTPSTEQANLWYTGSDFSEAKKRERSLRKYIQKQHQDYSEIADRMISEGIFTAEETAIKSITILNSISAVLDEQDRQEAEYDNNDEVSTDGPFVLDAKEIQQEYLVHSRVALAQAQNRARRHAQHMRDIDSQPDDDEVPTPPSRQGSSRCRRSPSRSPKLGKSKMSLVRRRTQYGRPVAPQVMKTCTTPAA